MRVIFFFWQNIFLLIDWELELRLNRTMWDTNQLTTVLTSIPVPANVAAPTAYVLNSMVGREVMEVSSR